MIFFMLSICSRVPRTNSFEPAITTVSGVGFIIYLPSGVLKPTILAPDFLRSPISYIVLFKEDTHRLSKEFAGDFVYNLSKGYDVPDNLIIVYNETDAIIYKVERNILQG